MLLERLTAERVPAGSSGEGLKWQDGCFTGRRKALPGRRLPPRGSQSSTRTRRRSLSDPSHFGRSYLAFWRYDCHFGRLEFHGWLLAERVAVIPGLELLRMPAVFQRSRRGLRLRLRLRLSRLERSLRRAALSHLRPGDGLGCHRGGGEVLRVLRPCAEYSRRRP